MEKLTELLLWHDTSPRSGAMNMAVDQVLLENISSVPVLRFYTWDRPSVSFGYFESLSNARATFDGDSLDFIRRWTGGGIVDHRADLTYTIAIPHQHPWATLRGSESYRIIHQAIAKALNQSGVECELISTNSGDGSANCFTNPVAHDIVTPAGIKIAGAGQKRSRHGLLHQGSVVGVKNIPQWQASFSKFLAESVTHWTPEVSFFIAANELAITRYGTQAWLQKRP